MSEQITSRSFSQTWICQYCNFINMRLDDSEARGYPYCVLCKNNDSNVTSTNDFIVDKSSLKVIEVNKSSELHLKLIEKASQSNSPMNEASCLSDDQASLSRPYSWYDVEFPPDRNSLFVKKAKLFTLPGFLKRNGLKKAKCWRRPNEINFHDDEKSDEETERVDARREDVEDSLNSGPTSSSLVPHHIYSNSSSQDVLQGGLGSCWFIAALCLMAERPELLAKTLISRQYNPNGFHQIRLCQRGQWTIVTIDDFLPCNRNGQMVFAYSRCKELWVSFIEKALAKLYGSYEAIVSGSCVEGLQTLTGEPCEIIYLDKIREKMQQHASASSASLSLFSGRSGKSSSSSFGLIDSLSTEQDANPTSLWNKLLNAKQSGHLMLALCFNKNLKFVDIQRRGLLNRHIYSILDVQELDDNGQKINLIKLRNPWGKKEWRGDWSNHWPNWPEALKSKLLPEGQDLVKSNQGCFWMSFKDVVKYFYDITICKVKSNGWFESRQSSYFYDFSSGSQAYLLNVFEPSSTSMDTEYDFEFELFASGRKFTKFDRNAHPEIDLCLVLCRIVTNESDLSTSLECIGFIHEVEYFTSISKRLPVGNYFILPCSFRAISNLVNAPASSYDNPNFYKYNLIVHGQCNFVLSQTILPASRIGDLFYGVALRENNIKYELNNSIRSLSVSSNSIHFIIVENLSAQYVVRVSLDLSQSKNLENTRCSSHITDYIEPRSRQLIMYLTPMDYRKVFVIGYKLEYQIVNESKSSHNNPSVPVFYSGLHLATITTTNKPNRR